jgi:hypothetical protein
LVRVNLKTKLNLKGGQTDDNSQYNGKSRKGKRKNRCKVLTSEVNPNPEKLSSTVLEKDFWLSDEHIDHAQWLLQQHFAGCNGLHSVLAFEGKPPKFREDKRSLFKSLMLEENIG